ncbi:MAG: kynureninase [Rhizobiaceae bacterium]|nr:kynureninase [Rhizobiaceae bacterium]
MSVELLQSKAADFDAVDPLSSFRSRFQLPEGVIYFDGNSLGPMLKSMPERISKTLHDEWATGLIRSWNDADWINLPETVAAKIAPLIGAKPECVTVTDSTSVNIFKVLCAALVLNKGRKRIVSEKNNFPTDLYLVEGVRDFLQRGHEVCLVEDDLELFDSITHETAVVLLTHVDFRTGRMLDMEALTKHAHGHGALVIWDLAHSAGALPVHLDEVGADFAVGCGYKYLNGGPGAPSFVYVNEEHLGSAWQPLTGWFSHKTPFAFDHSYEPNQSIKQFLCGTPPVLSMVALDESLKLWRDVRIEDVRNKSLKLAEFFLECVSASGLDDEFSIATPLEHKDRGSQISLRFQGDGYAVMQALIARGVIGDFRDPDILRFGFAPLYNTFGEIFRAVQHLKEIIEIGEWQQARFMERKAVT